jgi:hypothetical protein
VVNICLPVVVVEAVEAFEADKGAVGAGRREELTWMDRNRPFSGALRHLTSTSQTKGVESGDVKQIELLLARPGGESPTLMMIEDRGRG